MTEPTRPCGTCGMPCTPGEYHPYAACLMFKACHNSETVRANLEAVRGTPPTQAQAVLEDAERLDWLALAGPTSICVVIDRPNDGEVEVATDDVTGYGKTLREALDAARKQGGAT